MGGHGGEQGVGGQHQTKAALLQVSDQLRRCGVFAADLCHLLELVAVKRLKHRHIPHHRLAEDRPEHLPEHLLVGLDAVVFHHGGGTLPDGLRQLLGIIAQRGHLFGQQAQIGPDKNLLVHGQQRSVQVEQYGGDGHNTDPFRKNEIPRGRRADLTEKSTPKGAFFGGERGI